MIQFEKSASDPRRLFQSSFRLLEEDKWRKSCWPNLVKIEDQLINACIAYEEGKYFIFLFLFFLFFYFFIFVKVLTF